MVHYLSLDSVQLQDAWLTIGSFDGVHLGHQEIIGRLVAGAHKTGIPAVVLTFYPHPAVVLGKRTEPVYLTNPQDRANLLGGLGVDVVITHPFNHDVARMSASEFMARLKSHLGVSRLCVGQDFALGRNREGDVPTLRHIGEQMGYQVQDVTPYIIDGIVVSSSRIRASLIDGNVEQASRLLGRPYQIIGEVVFGDGKGKSMGVPTANLSVWSERALPKAGVYVCRAYVNGLAWGAVTAIGKGSTHMNQPVTKIVETHILDFNEEIYGQEIALDFLTYLSANHRFNNVGALVEKIQDYISQAGKVLNKESKNDD